MTTNSKIRLILVTGFLGSGKTTFIKRLLEKYSEGKRIGIIQNEYASANIDTEDLRSTGKKFEILEINNGSVFCICLLANFVDSLASFIEKHEPEMIIFEASGLSDPVGIAELLQHEKLSGKLYLSCAWCIIDSANFRNAWGLMDRLQRQVMISDWLIINKTDIGSENIAEIRKILISVNPDAEILETSYCNIGIDPASELLVGETVAMRQKEKHATITPSGRADISTVVLKTSRPISKEGLQLFLSEVENNVLRMKGFVMLDDGGRVRIQSQFGKTYVEGISWYNGPTELIGLGYYITPALFGRRFHEIRENTRG
jgi:G3E family GTPase